MIFTTKYLYFKRIKKQEQKSKQRSRWPKTPNDKDKEQNFLPRIGIWMANYTRGMENEPSHSTSISADNAQEKWELSKQVFAK